MYELKWSPFVPDVFLSCSADWSVKLWHQDSPSPIYTFTSSTVRLYLNLKMRHFYFKNYCIATSKITTRSKLRPFSKQ